MGAMSTLGCAGGHIREKGEGQRETTEKENHRVTEITEFHGEELFR
jgi:hypothetical protein